jgi:hypothetical protein
VASVTMHAKCIRNFSQKTEDKGHLHNVGIGGRIILKWILKEIKYEVGSIQSVGATHIE